MDARSRRRYRLIHLGETLRLIPVQLDPGALGAGVRNLTLAPLDRRAHRRRLHGIRLALGFVTGILFGFLLQKGGATSYNVILGQLLLIDFTVIKIMLSAVITGMIGAHFLKSIGLAQLHPNQGSLGISLIGALFFGIGFATLGYCPGTIAGTVGRGSLDALFGGVVGILIGSGLLAALYPKLQGTIMKKGDFGDLTLPRLLKVNHWVVVIPVAAGLIALLVWIERTGP